MWKGTIMKACLVVWCVLTALTVGLVPSVVAEPKGEVVFALHVTIAPAWFDPAEMPAQITPFIIRYTLHDALVLRTANYPASLAGHLPGLPGAYASYGTRGVFTAHGTKRAIACPMAGARPAGDALLRQGGPGSQGTQGLTGGPVREERLTLPPRPSNPVSDPKPA